MFFLGFTFYAATRVCGCELLTLRIISLPYLVAEVPRWRKDVPTIEHPVVRMFADRGKI